MPEENKRSYVKKSFCKPFENIKEIVSQPEPKKGTETKPFSKL